MFRLLLGLFKGALIGGSIAFAAYALGHNSTASSEIWDKIDKFGNWVIYCTIGAMVGLLVGRPFWRHLREKDATLWTPAIKAIFGAGIGAGLFALVKYFGSGIELSMLGETRALPDWQIIVGAGIGGLYGAFTELDDSTDTAKDSKKISDKSVADKATRSENQ